ncbi:DUF1349 domain-containing protein [Nonomuraea dietziae]|uniref:Regulation of enolase protein 1 (Concanavalin A-like superfamily) n=1 Tax=Nonomuraea dietziae TaxID=65515 RepID=A0A7W5YKP8_9ACTN|nr:DUF1349 domain-containing protein [Nonomuraea dietziae]MBB3724327.1 regulation of enolase protein 1 (concanavalin A-like superfamily) [Nonomuraea dietziae]
MTTPGPKVNYELAPGGVPTIFSVVTRNGRSDDAIGPVAGDVGMWLRISSLDGGYALHCSSDGRAWQLVRQFTLDFPAPVRVGLEAQSPIGKGCRAVFENVQLTNSRLEHLFDGR